LAALILLPRARIAEKETSMFGRRLVLAAAAAFPLLATAGISAAAGRVPAELQPAGYKLLFTAQASGVQIYTSVAEAGAPAKWVFEAPLARLTDTHGKLAAYHYAGPSWEAPDGSKIAHEADTPVKSAPAPKATADIPWLLVKVSADPAAGLLSKVGYVQRIETHGGVAPATPPARAGTRIGVPYTATYAFYAKAD
jgi:hypothetical protein